MKLYDINTFLLCLLLVIFVLASCEKNPTSPILEKKSNILVIVKDESGIPLKGVEVITYPKTVKLITDKDGRAFIENIPTKDYQVVISRSDIPIFYRDAELRMGQTLELKFVVANKVTINLNIKDISGQPLKDIVITTSPATSKVTTDEDGRAVLENIPVKRYTFIVKRGNSTAYVRGKRIIIRNGKLQDIEITVDSQSPFIKILSPENHNYQNIFDIHFAAEARDFEDGELPEDALIWYSNIDGEMGTGRELTVDRLSVGHHKITLAGTDSNQNRTERFIWLNLYYFEKESYFPIPQGGNWSYRYWMPKFSVINDNGETEYWTLSDLQVLMDDINTRNCTMQYTVTSESNHTIIYQYYLVDYFETDLENIYVTKTTEQLKIWKDIEINQKPSDQLNIETVYTPRYMIIKNHMDPSSESSYETTVMADVTWYFENVSFGSKIYSETVDVETYVKIGDIETIETDIGTFDAATVTVIQGETYRKWWLTKKLGLIQLEYNTLDFPLNATLYDTNILTYSENTLSKIPAHNSFSSTGLYFQKKLKTPQDSPERMLEICRFLRDLCPR